MQLLTLITGNYIISVAYMSKANDFPGSELKEHVQPALAPGGKLSSLFILLFLVSMCNFMFLIIKYIAFYGLGVMLSCSERWSFLFFFLPGLLNSLLFLFDKKLLLY